MRHAIHANRESIVGPFVALNSTVNMPTLLSQRVPSNVSERHAFERMGLGDPKVPEHELVRLFKNVPVPEGIFIDKDSQCVSVEVKRIIGNSLPSMAGGRRHIKRSTRGRQHIIWPWTSSVENALAKLHVDIAAEYNVKVHHAVFLVPRSLPRKSQNKVVEHINTTASRFLQARVFSTKVCYHIFVCNDNIFDRLL